MKNLLSIIVSLFFLLSYNPVLAQKNAGNSAEINYTSTLLVKKEDKVNYSLKKKTIHDLLEKYDSPMIDHVDDFIKVCQKYDLDCYLLPAISCLESTCGKFVLPDSYNPFGWGGGKIICNNWADCIERVAKGLREQYIDKGAQTLENIGRIYSESKTWASRVQYFVNQMQNLEEKNQLYFSNNQVEL